MKKTLQHWMAAIVFVAAMGGSTLALATPQTASAAGTCNDRLLTFPAWFRGLTDGDCNIKNPGSDGLANFIWTIVLNITEILLQLVGYMSVFFIIFGGFKYMTSAGAADGMVKARKTIMNAVVGLVISIFSIAIVNIVAGALK